MQSIRIEDIKTPLRSIEHQVDKKVWMKPLVTEISKFSILAGIDPSKPEGAGITFSGS
jgi:hypothetical protein